MSQTKGKTVNLKKYSRSPEVTSTEDAGDNLARLTFAVGTPTIDKQQTRQEERREDQKLQSDVDDWEENADLDDLEVSDKLDAAYKEVMLLEKCGFIPF